MFLAAMSSLLPSPVSSIFSSTGFIRKGRSVGRALVMMRASNHHDSINSSTSPLHTAGSPSSKNRIKVYENLSEGVVCYRDENGEIICEGYDEGPRLDCHQVSSFSCNSRVAEMVDLLERSWLKVEERKEQLMGEKMMGCETL
ncbi:PREDICTED: uncharacterized protein LOC109187501 isoform X2 [Ipomoea nil]|uniref:uncharacterized protein LOC109187501 isoform X2 n=1 Tax=Ipomoea nil TaxID=35883 RepID=UPI00090170BA|nr:PREDICTED: uncharacterized protein LOC109187501 isoform X2 [Ipomoea nil]